jgi:hypothetical protein
MSKEECAARFTHVKKTLKEYLNVELAIGEMSEHFVVKLRAHLPFVLKHQTFFHVSVLFFSYRFRSSKSSVIKNNVLEIY